jgi:DNA-binding Lrp family transcriptional regulator
MKDIELRLIAELMRNSRRSDRELARVLGVSQPTISRMIKKLEKERYIKEYSAIPDFSKLGFELMSFTLIKLKGQTAEAVITEKGEQIMEMSRKTPFSDIIAVGGMGLDADGIVVTFHEDYSSYTGFMDVIRSHSLVDVGETKSFLVSLAGGSQFRTLTLSEMANYIMKMKRRNKP